MYVECLCKCFLMFVAVHAHRSSLAMGHPRGKWSGLSTRMCASLPRDSGCISSFAIVVSFIGCMHLDETRSVPGQVVHAVEHNNTLHVPSVGTNIQHGFPWPVMQCRPCGDQEAV
jgi:hypothetical protein